LTIARAVSALITAFINVRLATSSDTVTLLNGAGVEPCAHAPAFAKDNAAAATARITPRRNNPASLIMYFSPLCALEVLLATLARAPETSGEFISTFLLELPRNRTLHPVGSVSQNYSSFCCDHAGATALQIAIHSIWY
jgi:hypothetical protein